MPGYGSNCFLSPSLSLLPSMPLSTSFSPSLFDRLSLSFYLSLIPSLCLCLPLSLPLYVSTCILFSFCVFFTCSLPLSLSLLLPLFSPSFSFSFSLSSPALILYVFPLCRLSSFMLCFGSCYLSPLLSFFLYFRFAVFHLSCFTSAAGRNCCIPSLCYFISISLFHRACCALFIFIFLFIVSFFCSLRRWRRRPLHEPMNFTNKLLLC